MHPLVLVIRSGGQTGVDRAALDCAIARGLPYTGWCPRGGWAEDFPAPPGLLKQYPDLIETPSTEPEQRTAWNVRDSDATLIIVRTGDLDASPGTALTLACAQAIFERPCHVADMARQGAAKEAAAWLARVVESRGSSGPRPTLLNVAGPRESESPGIYAATLTFIDRLL